VPTGRIGDIFRNLVDREIYSGSHLSARYSRAPERTGTTTVKLYRIAVQNTT